MEKIDKIKGYYFITDEKLSNKGSLWDAKNAISAGTKIIQYRNKSSSTRKMVEEAMENKKNLPRKSDIHRKRQDRRGNCFRCRWNSYRAG
jgi:thiamine monophosphate synthase